MPDCPGIHACLLQAVNFDAAAAPLAPLSLGELRAMALTRARAGQPPFTNALLRKYVTGQKARVHLVEALFQHPSDDVEAVAALLAKLPTLALKRVEKKVKAERPKDKDAWLVAAWARYEEQIAAKQVKVKVAGLSPVQECFVEHLSVMNIARLEKIIADLTVLHSLV